MDNVTRVKQILARLEKASQDMPWADMPAATDATESSKRAAKEGNEFINFDDEHNLRTIGLGRRLMSIDTAFYGVNKRAAAHLAEYIERNEETALEELKMEYRHKVKEYYSTLQAIRSINPADYAAEIDYQRVLAENYKKVKDMELKLEYISTVIRTVEDFKESEDDESSKREKAFQEDFDFSYLHTFWTHGYFWQ